MPGLTRKQVNEIVEDANNLVRFNGKAYSIIRSSGGVTEKTLNAYHRPKDGFLVVPPEVARKMSRPQGSKYIPKKYDPTEMSVIMRIIHEEEQRKRSLARAQAKLGDEIAKLSKIERDIIKNAKS